MILRYDRVFLLDLEEATIEAGQFVYICTTYILDVF